MCLCVSVFSVVAQSQTNQTIKWRPGAPLETKTQNQKQMRTTKYKQTLCYCCFVISACGVLCLYVRCLCFVRLDMSFVCVVLCLRLLLLLLLVVVCVCVCCCRLLLLLFVVLLCVVCLLCLMFAQSQTNQTIKRRPGAPLETKPETQNKIRKQPNRNKHLFVVHLCVLLVLSVVCLLCCLFCVCCVLCVFVCLLCCVCVFVVCVVVVLRCCCVASRLLLSFVFAHPQTNQTIK